MYYTNKQKSYSNGSLFFKQCRTIVLPTFAFFDLSGLKACQSCAPDTENPLTWDWDCGITLRGLVHVFAKFVNTKTEKTYSAK